MEEEDEGEEREEGVVEGAKGAGKKGDELVCDAIPLASKAICALSSLMRA